MKRAKPLRVTLKIHERDMYRLPPECILSVEEQTPAGWTRRLPDQPRPTRTPLVPWPGGQP